MCLTRNMDEQARAHLTRVLDFAPDHAGAREALGFVRLGDKWLSPAEIERMQQNAAFENKLDPKSTAKKSPPCSRR